MLESPPAAVPPCSPSPRPLCFLDSGSETHQATVAADTSPIDDLLLTGEIELLPRLFGRLSSPPQKNIQSPGEISPPFHEWQI